MGSTSSQNFPEIVNEYLIRVKEFIKENEQLNLIKQVTGPSVYHSEKNWSVLFNVFPLNNETTTSVFERLILVADQLATQFAGKNGEIIAAQIINGEIRDQGYPYFEITRGHIFECYHYDEESFVYLRVYQEKKQAESNTWISLDIDYIQKSAWFTEKVSL